MSEIVKFPINSCSSCGAPTNQKIELLNFDTGENTGVKYLCPKCQPLDEDGLRLLVDKRDREIAALRKALKQIADLGWDDDDPEYEIARE